MCSPDLTPASFFLTFKMESIHCDIFSLNGGSCLFFASRCSLCHGCMRHFCSGFFSPVYVSISRSDCILFLTFHNNNIRQEHLSFSSRVFVISCCDWSENVPEIHPIWGLRRSHPSGFFGHQTLGGRLNGWLLFFMVGKLRFIDGENKSVLSF